jgi:type II secretory pathway component GspD/PulD (secretin)
MFGLHFQLAGKLDAPNDGLVTVFDRLCVFVTWSPVECDPVVRFTRQASSATRTSAGRLPTTRTRRRQHQVFRSRALAQGGGGGRGGRQTDAERGLSAAAGYGGGGPPAAPGAPGTQVRIVADPRTNTIMMHSTFAVFKRIRGVVQALDIPQS